MPTGELTPRGKVIGGSCVINGMIFIRATPWTMRNGRPMAAWKTGGLRPLLPYFRRMENA
jgi:choline dehydrogenase-like flavoprotein